jgi:hypothetical protein
MTEQVRGTHSLPLMRSITDFLQGTRNKHAVLSPRTCISLYSGSLGANVNKSSHPDVRTPRGIVCRRLLGVSARAHSYPYSMDSASLTQCGRDVTTRRVFPSSPLRRTHLIPPEGRLDHVVFVCVGLGHCLLTAAMSSLDDKQRLSRISVSGPQDEVWNGQARCCLQSRYYVSLIRRSNGYLSCHLVVPTVHGGSKCLWRFILWIILCQVLQLTVVCDVLCLLVSDTRRYDWWAITLRRNVVSPSTGFQSNSRKIKRTIWVFLIFWGEP